MSACTTSSRAPVISKEVQPAQRMVKNSSASNSKSKTSFRTIPSAKTIGAKNSAVINRGYHIVSKGDTLYSIAWRYGYDFRDLSSWNSIASPYTIYPGQIIRFKRDPNQEKSVLQPGPIVEKSLQQHIAKTDSKKNSKPDTPNHTVTVPKKIANKQQASIKIPKDKPIQWSWPTKGKIIHLNSPTSKKGVDIAGRLGQDVVAAAVGNVVYSGSGLLGYGQLIIIKHNEKYLSAYAHNSQILVKEGDVVSAGQLIAKMGQTSQGRTLLHFEIRKNGKPVNPETYLPKI